jgi:hypothetical protein
MFDRADGVQCGSPSQPTELAPDASVERSLDLARERLTSLGGDQVDVFGQTPVG